MKPRTISLIMACLLFVLVVVGLAMCVNQAATKKPKEVFYKLYLFDDSMSLYDGNRLVKSFAYSDSSLLSKTVLRDNDF